MLTLARDRILILSAMFSIVLVSACGETPLEKRKQNVEVAEAWMSAAFSQSNIELAKSLMLDDFSFTYRGETHLSNVSYDKEKFFSQHLVTVGELLPDGIELITTDVIADNSGVALLMEGKAEGVNGEYNNRYVFTFKIENGRIRSVTEYNSDLLVMTRLYKNQLLPIQ